jgi:hypothetical protein
MISLHFVKPLIKSLIKPWILLYVLVQAAQLFYSSWALWFLAQIVLLYGAVERRKAYTYFPAKPEWFIHWLDILLDTMIMYHESFCSGLKMFRMTLPFLGNYQWIHRSDARITGKQNSTSLLAQLSRPATALPSATAPKPPCNVRLTDPQDLTPKQTLPIFSDIDDAASESSGDFDQAGEHTMLKSPSQAENISTKLANLVDTEEDFVQSVNEVREIIDRVQKMKKDE